MASESKPWVTTASVCGAMLIVPVVGTIVMLSLGEEGDAPDAPASGDEVNILTGDATPSPRNAPASNAPAAVKRCCLALDRQAKTAAIDKRPAYAEAAAKCAAQSGTTEASAILTVVDSALGALNVPVPGACRAKK